MLTQLVDHAVEQCEKAQDNGEGEAGTEVKEDAQQEGEAGKEEDDDEDELDAAVRAEAAEMAQTMQAMGWEVPLSFGGGDGGPGSKGKGRRKRQRNAIKGAAASSHNNKHIRFGEDGEGTTPAASSSSSSLFLTFFPADGKDEAPTACFTLPPFPFSSSSSSSSAAAAQAPPPQKYWMQRFRLFSQFDLGCRLDEEGWFSVTPERIARHIAERSRSDVVVDLFVGCGGNAIQFALASHYVLAIDLDPTKLALARHNARIYGVADRIEFILGDALTLLPRLGALANVLFLSPPWGGPEYASAPTYSLDQIQLKGGVGGKEMMRRVLEVCPSVCVLLPRNVDLRELAEVGGGRKCEVEENVLNYKLKTITVYYGEWFLPAPVSDWTMKKQQQQRQQGGGGGRGGGGKKKKRNKRQRMKGRAEREALEGGGEEAVDAMLQS